MNLSYPVKHWLTSLAIGPLLLMLYEAFFSLEGVSNSMVQMYHVFFLVGVFCSLPVLALYVLAFYFLMKTDISSLLVKTILCCGVVIGVYFTFKLIGGSLEVPLIIAYSIAVVISSLFYKIQKA